MIFSYGLVKSYDMPCNVESASLEPKFGNKFVAGGEDLWVHVFYFHRAMRLVSYLTFNYIYMFKLNLK